MVGSALNFNRALARGRLSALAGLGLALAGCTNGLMSSSGPSTGRVIGVSRNAAAALDIQVVALTPDVVRRVSATERRGSFAALFGDTAPTGMVAGVGDILEVIVWEAPPASLFGTSGMASPAATRLSGVDTSRPTTLPEQMIDRDGRISVPFAGSVVAAGKTPVQISQTIQNRLAGKAHLPQVIVRIVRNSTSNVTVVGEVTRSARMPLTVRGERLLDAIAEAGGVKQAVDKITVQVTRDDRVEAMPLAAVIADPRENIVLRSGDVVTATYQPLSFTVLGATGKNEEVPFEAKGITLAQALGRVGGLQDQRADARGVFIFRFEDPRTLAPEMVPTARTPDGRVPVIYRVDLRDPASFFTAQGFPIRDKDVLYVSNAPLADVQKFVNIISSSIFPIVSLGTAVQ